MPNADWLLTLELAVGLVLGLIFTALLTMITRRRVISRGNLLTLCALAPDGATSWRTGLLRFGSGEIEWFTVNGWTIRPRHRWSRRTLQLGQASALPDAAGLDLVDPVSVSCRHGDQVFHLAMAQAAYTALRSWVEAAPPGATSTVH